MHKLRQEKHAGTELGTAADTDLANTQGSSSEAGHNATITKSPVENRGQDYEPDVPGVTADEIADDSDTDSASTKQRTELKEEE